MGHGSFSTTNATKNASIFGVGPNFGRCPTCGVLVTIFGLDGLDQTPHVMVSPDVAENLGGGTRCFAGKCFDSI